MPQRAENGRLFYAFDDLVSIRVAKELIAAGVSLQRVRRCLETLRQQAPGKRAPLASMRVRTGVDGLVAADGDTKFEATSGQLLLDFDVEALREEVAAVVCLPWVGRNAGLREQGDDADDLGSAMDWFERAVEWEGQWDGNDPSSEVLEEAKRAYEKALEADPSFAAALTNLGTLFANCGEIDAARDYYDQALAYEPEQPEARCNLAELALRTGEQKLAVDGFRAVLKLIPDHLDGHYGIARAFMGLGLQDQALRHLERFCAGVEAIAKGEWDDEMEHRLACARAVIDTIRSGNAQGSK